MYLRVEFLGARNSSYERASGKTTGPARYDLNQIPYKYAVEIMHRFKGLNLVNRVPELWTEVCITVQEAANKTIPK